MNNGVVKKVDELGRIVIPKEIRKNLKINNGDVLKISVSGDNIELSKYSDVVNNLKSVQKLYDCLQSIYNVEFLFTDREKILISRSTRELGVNELVLKCIEQNEIYYGTEYEEILFEDYALKGYFLISPVCNSISTIGSIIICSNTMIDSSLVSLIKFLSIYLSKLVDIYC